MNSELPDGWTKLNFKQCIERTPSANKFKIQQSEFKEEGKYPVIDQGQSFIAGYTDSENKAYNGELPVIIFGDHTLIFKFIDFPFVLGADGTQIIRPREDILVPKYFYYYLLGIKIESHGYSRHYKFLKEKDILIPPLETQHKIVAILEKAEETKKLRAQADELTQQLLQSVFLEMFGEPVRNPKKWDTAQIADVIESIEAGWSANGEQRLKEKDECGVLKVSAVTWGEFLPNEHKAIKHETELKKVVTPEKGDVLFSRANTLDLVGATCLIRDDYPDLLLPDKLWKIRVNHDLILPEVFKFILSMPSMRAEISQKSTGTSGSMYNISMVKLKAIHIPVPSLEVQKKFSQIYDLSDVVQNQQDESRQNLDCLFNALMQKAFNGELVAE